MNVILGKTDNNNDLQIGDIERRSGLYILGKPRMGKSWLLINMILQDLEKERGIFFIDPHGDAIDQLITHINTTRSPVAVYDFEDEERIFCTNPLAGKRSDPAVRNQIFAKTKALFDKLWKNTFEEKPWLQLIIQNTIYTFIETPGYTLTEFPMFFRDRDFRYFLVGNMQYNMQVKDYWLKTFASKDRRNQDSIMEAAQTRCEIMFAHPVVRHFFGYGNYIDIEDCVQTTRPRFVKLSTRLPYEVEKIIGTALINELVFAIQKRKPGGALYCLYIDEFQNFVSFEDMATLITQAPKYGLSTTLAHHERFGQLEDNRGIVGATSTIANKVLFQVTGKDAHDFAPEFAKEPTVESRFKDQLVISQNPFWDLLYGHSNPEVRSSIEEYLRPIKERLEDIHGEARAESLMRMEYLDTASLYRLDERMEGVNIAASSAVVQRGLLHGAGQSIQRAKSQTEKLQILNEESQTLRRLIRSLNKLFISVMEGKVSPYSSDFRKALVEQVKYFDLIDILEPLYHIHCLIIQGEDRADELINPRTAGKYDYRFDKDSEFKYPNVFRNSPNQDQCRAFERTLYDFITDLGETDIERMETLTKKRFQEALLIHKKHVPVTRAPYAQRWNALHHNIKTILEPLCDLKAVCVLLQRPENHLRVRSNQQVERKVPIRTVADMTNEMVQELTELPKYTAYVKVLQGKSMLKEKITTHLLPTKTYTYTPDMLRYIINGYCFNRAKIEGAIRKRQENWRPTPVSEPRVVCDKDEKGLAGSPGKPVVEQDGPPPTSRPKPRR